MAKPSLYCRWHRTRVWVCRLKLALTACGPVNRWLVPLCAVLVGLFAPFVFTLGFVCGILALALLLWIEEGGA